MHELFYNPKTKLSDALIYTCIETVIKRERERDRERDREREREEGDGFLKSYVYM